MSLDYDYVETRLVEWLKGKIQEAGAEGAVVGLSGGIDSSVTSVLCKKAFGDNMLGIIMPCKSSVEDREDAELIARHFNIEYITRDLGSLFDEFLTILTGKNELPEDDMAVANIKPRLRMITLYYYAARNNYLVVGTDNWSELKTGYFTKYGDGGIDIAPLGSLVKTEVRELARHLSIPEKIIEKKPSAGLWQGQSDEEEMGLSYQALDKYILTGEASPKDRDRIEGLAQRNAHKLAPPPIPSRDEISSP